MLPPKEILFWNFLVLKFENFTSILLASPLQGSKGWAHWNGLTVTVRRFFPEYQLQLVVELGRADFFRTQARQFGLGPL